MGSVVRVRVQGPGSGLASANLVVDELDILPLYAFALVLDLLALENVPVELRWVRAVGSWVG